MSELPTDLQEIILNQVYKRGLPKVSKKMHLEVKKGAQTSLKKVNQICDYKSFDKKSLENQEKKLKDMFVAWLLWANSPGQSASDEIPKPTSFIGPRKKFLLNGTLIELNAYWTNDDIQNYFIYLIKSINFKNKNAFSLMLQFILDCNENNLIKTKFLLNGTLPELNAYWTNDDIQNYFIYLIKSINFKNENAFFPMLQFIIDCNENNLIKKKTLDDIILDTVKKNRKKICKYLDKEFIAYLE
jgi:hypothetical protein